MRGPAVSCMMTLYQSVSMERCDPVKKIAVDMPGKLYSNGIELALGREGKLCSFTLNHAAPARQIEECRIRQADVLLLGVSDPGSNAETLFKWNQKEKIWESDHGTYLDMDHMDEWLKQRASDRQWADEQMKNLKNRKTAFDRDIDAMKKRR